MPRRRRDSTEKWPASEVVAERLAALREAAEGRRAAVAEWDERLVDFVYVLRHPSGGDVTPEALGGESWSVIGAALGCSGQAAQQRFALVVDQRYRREARVFAKERLGWSDNQIERMLGHE